MPCHMALHRFMIWVHTEAGSIWRLIAGQKQSGTLPIRIYSFVALAFLAKLDSFVKINGRGNDRLRWGGLKGFVDGSLGSTTAWFYQTLS